MCDVVIRSELKCFIVESGYKAFGEEVWKIASG